MYISFYFRWLGNLCLRGATFGITVFLAYQFQSGDLCRVCGSSKFCVRDNVDQCLSGHANFFFCM